MMLLDITHIISCGRNEIAQTALAKRILTLFLLNYYPGIGGIGNATSFFANHFAEQFGYKYMLRMILSETRNRIKLLILVCSAGGARYNGSSIGRIACDLKCIMDTMT